MKRLATGEEEGKGSGYGGGTANHCPEVTDSSSPGWRDDGDRRDRRLRRGGWRGEVEAFVGDIMDPNEAGNLQLLSFAERSQLTGGPLRKRERERERLEQSDCRRGSHPHPPHPLTSFA